GPTLRPLRLVTDELMGDGLRLDERMRDHPAVKIAMTANAERCGFFAKKNVIGDEKDRVGIIARCFMAPAELTAHELGDQPGIGIEHQLLMTAQPPAQP